VGIDECRKTSWVKEWETKNKKNRKEESGVKEKNSEQSGRKRVRELEGFERDVTP
jgi:hypothetical protein